MNPKTIQELNSRELWLDFETWLHKNYGKTLPDLSWNDYAEYSTKYNNERLDFDTTKIRHGLGRGGINA